MGKKLKLAIILALTASFAFGQIAAGQKTFVAAGNPTGVGGDKAGMIGISKDGAKWELIALADIDESMENAPLSGIAYGGGKLVAVGGGKAVVSSNMKDWKLSDSQPDGINGNLNAVAYGEGLFVAVGTASSVVYSKDGEEWKTLLDSKNLPPQLVDDMEFRVTHLYGIVFQNGKFYALGNGNCIVTLAPQGDGLVLEGGVMKGQVTSRLNDMAFGNGSYVAVGTVEDYLSADLSAWKKIQPWQQYFGVTYGKGLFVGVTGFGSVFTSDTGASGSWKEASSAKIQRNNYFSAAFGNDTFIAGGNGQVAVSKDGLAWKVSNVNMRLKRIVYLP